MHALVQRLISLLMIQTITYPCLPTIILTLQARKDNVAVKYGNQLTNVCISSGLRIVNGRIFGDTVGQLTCHTSTMAVV